MGVASPEPSSEEFGVDIRDDVLYRLRQLPVFVMGSSMGGMIGMYIGLRLQSNERLCSKFRGAILGCPSLAVDLPPPAVQALLRAVVVPLFKHWEMPPAVSSSSKPRLSWSYDLSVRKLKDIAETEVRDCSKKLPGVGLGWHLLCVGALRAHSQPCTRASRRT